MTSIETDRLLLRRWHPADRLPFARLNADPDVMAHYPSVMTAAESDALVDRIEAEFERDGYGLWAVEVRETAEFIGYVGLWNIPFAAHFTPATEIGWRLSRAAWGHGYASEAARASLRFGFEEVGLSEIVSMTVPANVRSRAVMERLHMERNPDEDFAHPSLAADHPLSTHVLYRLGKPRWAELSPVG